MGRCLAKFAPETATNVLGSPSRGGATKSSEACLMGHKCARLLAQVFTRGAVRALTMGQPPGEDFFDWDHPAAQGHGEGPECLQAET